MATNSIVRTYVSSQLSEMRYRYSPARVNKLFRDKFLLRNRPRPTLRKLRISQGDEGHLLLLRAKESPEEN